MRSVIGFSGKKGSGKDTACDYLVGCRGYHKLSFAGPLKQACKTLFNLSDTQLYGNKKETIDMRYNLTPRHILQYIGTDCIRSMNLPQSLFVMRMEEECKKLLSEGNKIAIADVRFPDEVALIHKLGGIVININRANIEANEFSEHQSETQILNSDYIIENNDTLADLYAELEKIII